MLRDTRVDSAAVVPHGTKRRAQTMRCTGCRAGFTLTSRGAASLKHRKIRCKTCRVPVLAVPDPSMLQRAAGKRCSSGLELHEVNGALVHARACGVYVTQAGMTHSGHARGTTQTATREVDRIRLFMLQSSTSAVKLWLPQLGCHVVCRIDLGLLKVRSGGPCMHDSSKCTL